MARLARGRAAYYQLRPPAVVGPIAILPKGPTTRLATQVRTYRSPQYRYTSFLRAPAAVAQARTLTPAVINFMSTVTGTISGGAAFSSFPAVLLRFLVELGDE